MCEKLKDIADRDDSYQEETLETAGCTGGCLMHPGAFKTEDGYPDCTKCPQFQKENKREKMCVKCGKKPGKPHYDNGLYCGDDMCDGCFEEMVQACRRQSW